jgi:2-polyprenyl-3-methyl-5-hydroxy-6-metoxy-1,4-benzoquinol methylase
MGTVEHKIGKQEGGSSHHSIKRMAQNALSSLDVKRMNSFADIGAGLGQGSRWFWDDMPSGYLVDHAVQLDELPAHIHYVPADLNESWPLADHSIELLISLEVIEHLENPRHFFRQMNRVMQADGYAFISTPYNLNLTARILFLLKGQHRHFQDFSYPAHITALLPVDFRRLALETGFELLAFHYNYMDVLPVFKTGIHIKHPLFSNSVGVLLKKVRP